MNIPILVTAVAVLVVLFLYGAICVAFARMFTRPFPRALTWPLRQHPSHVDLEAEDVSFEAADGVRICGWFFERGESAVVLVPGGGLNRLNDNTAIGETIAGERPPMLTNH
jgi:hypothetical protein